MHQFGSHAACVSAARVSAACVQVGLGENKHQDPNGGENTPVKFAFDSDVWREAIKETVVLRQVGR